MIQIAGVALLLYCIGRGGNPIGIALLASGVVLHLVLTVRLLRVTRGAGGGHAEWVREVSDRPRARNTPAWLAGSALVAIGAVVALFAG